MRFENRTVFTSISDAISKADKLLKIGSAMTTEVNLKTDWKYDKIAIGTQVTYGLVLKKYPALRVFTYKPFNPWTSAIAYFDGNNVHFNIRKLPDLTVNQITGTLLHEYAHYCGFTHGNNWKTEEKCLYSVPYYLSENVSRWL